ncbi:MAG TPA: hypothetical protein PK836_10065 [Syntrophales bacterium]|nr:hypothetical protein [Syntrophales bacterium]HOM06709.1 hypothetical protein [Syntrophales bacterium]HOO00901.1 hypothetical protein [Syntrophales bacterium]HPC02006.1 hypothetical protein [Syntrophales bacterium]HPQ06133.1 hypothetical protein [Syntrophales bacterium]
MKTAGSGPEGPSAVGEGLGPSARCREILWCERHRYFIDTEACAARARSRPACRRCLARRLQGRFFFAADF